MPEEPNLAQTLERIFPPHLIDFLKHVGEKAAERNEQAYIVGGAVRDLILGIKNCDIDLTVEGDAAALAREVAPNGEKITIHQQFNTARIKFADLDIDFATARSETYARPGALPKVTPATLTADLKRRDFTINAMAIGLCGENYGKLYDPYNGKRDIEGKILRVLHDKSFVDDSTRIWRGLRYEKRLGFNLEEHALNLLQRDIPMLDTVSGERIRYEIECVLKEARPEEVLSRAYELEALGRLNPALEFNQNSADCFIQARETSAEKMLEPLYWALLTFALNIEEKNKLITYLKLPKRISQTLRDCAAVRERLAELASPELKRSGIYRLLHGFTDTALEAAVICADNDASRAALVLYLQELQGIKTIITGDDLLGAGMRGGEIKYVLDAVLDARLNGEVATFEEELALAKTLL